MTTKEFEKAQLRLDIDTLTPLHREVQKVNEEIREALQAYFERRD